MLIQVFILEDKGRNIFRQMKYVFFSLNRKLSNDEFAGKHLVVEF
jgi:hypothetical protein